MMEEKILRLLRSNAKLTAADIAERLDTDEKSVAETVGRMEKNGTIKGYQAVIDESILPESKVKAIIEINVRPQREGGFDGIARRLANFPEVSSLYLVSGAYDLGLEIQGESLQEVAAFVSSKLATIEGVTSTATHFILKKYKESGKFMDRKDEYKKLTVTP
jgi:DNA-binding Lrp family transcriptional regulator